MAMKKRKETVFVVDDSKITLEAVAKDLERTAGCRVKTFTTAEDCLMALDEKPDMIVSDYYLDSAYSNRMNGDIMLEKIRKRYPGLPVIMYSGKDDTRVAGKLIRLGAVDFVPRRKYFLQALHKTVLRELHKIRKRYTAGVTTHEVVVTGAVFVAITLLLRALFPDALPYFMIGSYLAGAAWLFHRQKPAPKKMNVQP